MLCCHVQQVEPAGVAATAVQQPAAAHGSAAWGGAAQSCQVRQVLGFLDITLRACSIYWTHQCNFHRSPGHPRPIVALSALLASRQEGTLACMSHWQPSAVDVPPSWLDSIVRSRGHRPGLLAREHAACCALVACLCAVHEAGQPWHKKLALHKILYCAAQAPKRSQSVVEEPIGASPDDAITIGGHLYAFTALAGRCPMSR